MQVHAPMDGRVFMTVLGERSVEGAKLAKLPDRLTVGRNEGKTFHLGGVRVVFKVSRRTLRVLSLS